MKRNIFMTVVLIIAFSEASFASPGTAVTYQGDYKNSDVKISIRSRTVRPPQGGRTRRVRVRHSFTIAIQCLGNDNVSAKSYVIINNKKHYFNKKLKLSDKKYDLKSEDVSYQIYRRKLSFDNLNNIITEGVITVYYEFQKADGGVSQHNKLRLSLNKGKLINTHKDSTIYSRTYQLEIQKSN